MERLVQVRFVHHHLPHFLPPGTHDHVRYCLLCPQLEAAAAGALQSAGLGRSALLLVGALSLSLQGSTFRSSCKLHDCGCCLSFRFLPESARWLLTQGRRERAIKEIRRAAKVNGRQVSQELLDKVIEPPVRVLRLKSCKGINEADFEPLAFSPR